MKSPASGTSSGRREVGLGMRVPGATYRLQFHVGFTFAQAQALLDYLQVLGITDVYASPLFEAGPGSTHGYDTCSHERIGECLGGEKAFEAFAEALRDRGMGLLLDIVPNHMGAYESNAAWWNVLKHGRASRYAGWFDIDWERGGGKVVLPVLGDQLESAVAAGQLTLASRGEEPVVKYFDQHFPLAPGSPRKREEAESLLRLLEAQHYRLTFWRDGLREINYRRFFDVSGLVALRTEDATVFEEAHRVVFDLLRAGKITGLRVDHPDGLRDPREYFERLQRAAGVPPATRQDAGGTLYVVAEKILTGPEQLPADWPVAGTSGYDFLVQNNALFVARENEAAMTALYREFTGCAEDFHDVAYRSKKRVLEMLFVSEVNALADRLCALPAVAPETFTRDALRAALCEVIACFPVYRTYVRADTATLSPVDAAVVRNATRQATGRAPERERAIEFLARVLELRVNPPGAEAREFLLKFQQLTGPAAAKGIEDTAFYNYFRLVSLNEVGGEPGEFGLGVEEFHRRNRDRAACWPHSLLATATHDTKRGEDTRARINVLSEMPHEWRAAVLRWREVNAKHRSGLEGESAPDANDEYLFYQTLVGAAPFDGQITGEFIERLAQYMLKAIKEAKRHTSWTEPNAAYENATKQFVERVLGDAGFLTDFFSFHRAVAFHGIFNSLAQTLLKLTSPGVPDIYQGCELWDFSLVDPDNRRPVDYARRAALLRDVDKRTPTELLENPPDGAVKMLLFQRALRFRHEHRELFDRGDYVRLATNSPHVVAFARIIGATACISVVPRLLCTLRKHGSVATDALPLGASFWREANIALPAELRGRAWQNLFTGERVAAHDVLPVAETFATFPVALLTMATNQ